MKFTSGQWRPIHSFFMIIRYAVLLRWDISQEGLLESVQPSLSYLPYSKPFELLFLDGMGVLDYSFVGSKNIV